MLWDLLFLRVLSMSHLYQSCCWCLDGQIPGPVWAAQTQNLGQTFEETILIVLQVVVMLSEGRTTHLPGRNCCSCQCSRPFCSPQGHFLGFPGLWQYFAVSNFLSFLGCQGNTMRMKTQLHEGEKRKGERRREEGWVFSWAGFEGTEEGQLKDRD